MDKLACVFTACVALYILQQVYTDTNSMLYVEEGLTAIIECPMKPVLYWKDHKGTIYSFDLTANDQDKRINITNDYNLVIQNVSLVDEQTFTCETLDENRIVKLFNISLFISKEPTHMRIQNSTNLKEVFTNEGEKFKITCTVNTGIPAETLKWFSDQHMIAVGGPKMLIYEFTPNKSNDGQNFTCLARNNITNTSLKKTISLRLYLKPKVYVKASPSTNVDEGKQLNLSCYYESNIAHDSVYWYNFRYEQINVSRNRSFNLFISNSSKDDRGTYFCKVKNRVGIGVANITVTVNFRPTVIVHHKNYTTQLEKAKRILLKVESYPEPSASWAKSAGGKLGVWKVSKYEDLQLLNTYDCTFYLESSIKPTNEEHFGLYMVAIRNDIGSIELPVQLHIERILGYNITVETGRTQCIASSSVNITCGSLNMDNNTVDVKWKHYFHAELVQTFQGKSMLGISHCDYRDGGDYICEWMSNGTRLSGRSSLAIIGPPIISQQTISIRDEFVFISIDFHCEGGAPEISWYMNDVRLDFNNTDHWTTIKASNISVQVHRHTINITGFITTLVFNKNQIPTINKINCQVRKYSYSSEVVVSKEDILENLYISMSDRTEINIYQDVSNVTLSSKKFGNSRSTLYISVPLTTAFLLILLFGVGYRMWRSNKGLEKILQQMEMQNREHADIPVQMRELTIATEDHYDAISSDLGSTYYHAVEWHNTVTVMDSDD